MKSLKIQNPFTTIFKSPKEEEEIKESSVLQKSKKVSHLLTNKNVPNKRQKKSDLQNLDFECFRAEKKLKKLKRKNGTTFVGQFERIETRGKF